MAPFLEARYTINCDKLKGTAPLATVRHNQHLCLRTRDTLPATVAVLVALLWWSTAAVAALPRRNFDSPGTPSTLGDRCVSPISLRFDASRLCEVDTTSSENRVFFGARASGATTNRSWLVVDTLQVPLLDSVDPA